MPSPLVAAVDRPLELALRPELQIAAGADGRIIATDPLNLAHHELSAEEHALLGWLSPRSTLRSLQTEYHRRFAPRRISPIELEARLRRLYEAGLLLAAKQGQGDALWRRREETRSKKRRAALAHLLAIRIRGFDPDRLLKHLNAWFGWVFSAAGGLLLGAMLNIAALLLLGNASRFVADLPTLHSLGDPQWMITLALSLGCLKTLHELGHGVACKRFGGEVREMGVMLLALMPCLYCDVSDAWRLESKRKRVLINSAGVLVEIAAACVAVFVWRFTEPGWIHLLAMNVVLVASLGTALVNFNPLLRYDGYYVLSDLLGVANLWARSRTACRQRLAAWFSHDTDSAPPSEPLWMACYGLASQAYLVLVIAGLAWMVLGALKAWRLEAIGWGAVVLIAASLLTMPLGRVVKAARRPRRHQSVRWARVVITTLVAGLVGSAVWHTPWSNRPHAQVRILPRDASPVAVTLPGRLTWTIEQGATVGPGAPLASLTNHEVARRILRAEADLRAAELEVELLEAQRRIDPQASAKLPGAQEAVAQRAERLQELRNDAKRLTLTSPQEGVVLCVYKQADRSPGETLARWDTDALDAMNLGAWVEAGEVLCEVAPHVDAEIELLVDGADAGRVSPGQTVRVALSQTNGEILTAKVTHVARRVESISVAGIDREVCRVLADFDPGELERLAQPLVYEGVGVARIDTGDSTIGDLVMAALRRKFQTL